MNLLIVLTLCYAFFAGALPQSNHDSHLPAVLLVPGAFHQAKVYEKIVPRLTSAGYTHVEPMELSSVGHLATRQDEIKPVVEAMRKHIDAGRDVVLVGNSYGATVIGEAVQGFPRYPLDSTLKDRGSVLGLIFLNGEIPLITDVTHPETHADIRTIAPLWMTFTPPDHPTMIRWDGNLTVSPPQKTFYNLLPQAEADYWATQLRFESFAAGNATPSYVPYAGDFRVVYLAGLQDNTVPEPAWETFVNQPGARMVLEKIDTDHISMLSRPDEVTALIRKYAEKRGPWSA